MIGNLRDSPYPRLMIFPWNDVWDAGGATKIMAYSFNSERQLVFQYMKNGVIRFQYSVLPIGSRPVKILRSQSDR